MKIKVGDKVIITQSEQNWHDTMDLFVGKIVTVKDVYCRPDYRDRYGNVGNTSILFDDICIYGRRSSDFQWILEQGHFKLCKAGMSDYIGPVFSKSFLDFLEDIKVESRVARLILSCRSIKLDGLGSLVEHVLTNELVDYITYRQDGNISYLPAGKSHLTNEDGSWKRDGRQDGRPSKVIRKIFKPNVLKILKEADFEVFNNKYKARFSLQGFTFKVLPATDIPNVYCWDILESGGGGSLQGSCMNGDSEYLDIYKYAGDVLQIIVLVNQDGYLAGRALLWKAKVVSASDEDAPKAGEEIMFMDRIYVAKDMLYEAFLEYAAANNYYRKKSYNSFSNKSDLIGKSGLVNVVMRVDLETEYDWYPYIDTFSYGDDGMLTNDESRRYEYTYNETNGHREGGRVEDEITGRLINREDATEITEGSHRGQITHMSNACEVNGEYYYINDDDIVYSEYLGNYILLEDAVEVDDSWYPSDCDAICYITKGSKAGEYALTSDCYEVNGDYYHEDDVNKL